MLGALIAIFAGWNTKRLWPLGAAFLIVWPAIAVVIQMPSQREALQRLGETLELTPQLYFQAYLMTALVSAAFFFVVFGLKRLKDRWQASRNQNPKQSEEVSKAKSSDAIE